MAFCAMSARESIALSIIKMNMKRAQEIIDEAIFSHEGCFDANDLKKDIARILQTYFKYRTPDGRVKLCKQINAALEFYMEVYSHADIIEYVGNGKYKVGA